MASDFLRSMAQKQAEKIDREFGANAYGGSEWLQKQNSSAVISTNKNEQQQQLTLADLKAQREQLSKEYDIVDDEYKNMKGVFGSYSMTAKGGWVSNYRYEKATGKKANQFDMEAFNKTIGDRNRIKKEIKALDAVISQMELDEYIAQNYGSMNNDTALAMSEKELRQAKDEYNNLKKNYAIGAKSNKSSTIEQQQQLAAAKEKLDMAKDVNTYFKDAVWWDDADVDRERLEKIAQRDPSYSERIANTNKALNKLSGGVHDSYMTAEEMATLAVLQSIDPEDAKRYQEIIDYDINKRKYEARKENLAEAGWLANLLAYYGSTAADPLATIDNAWRVIVEWVTGEYKPVDYYSAAYIGPQTREIAESNILNSIESPQWRQLAEFGLDVGTELLTLLVGKGVGKLGATAGKIASIGYSNVGVTSNSIYYALKSGASREEALAIGISDGLVDTAFELISIPDVFKTFNKYKGTKKLLTNETMEYSLAEEGISLGKDLVANYVDTFNNMLILGDKSEFNIAIKDYVDLGLSLEEAYDAAVTDFFITKPLISLGNGVLSRGLFKVSNITLKSYRKHHAQAIKYNNKNDEDIEASELELGETSNNNEFKNEANFNSKLNNTYQAVNENENENENEIAANQYYTANDTDERTAFGNLPNTQNIDDPTLFYLYNSKYPSDKKTSIALNAGIPMNTYLTFISKISDITGKHNGGNEIIGGSKKMEIMNIIDSLDLTVYQKNILYELSGYSESTMFDAPWYNN